MRTKVKCIGLLMLSLQVASRVAAAENYICVADQSVGFVYDKPMGWHSDTFSVRDEKYTMTTEKGERVWKKIGDPLPLRRCKESQNYIECDMVVTHLMLNKEILRFQIIYGAGYVEGLDRPDDTPYIEIGRCSSMQ